MMALCVVLIAGCLALFVPALAIAVCLLLLAIQLLFIGLRLVISPKRRRIEVDGSDCDPWFSIHVATHDEPPALVIQTLDSLAALDFPADRFEVIVLDNNTSDASLWQPVARHCIQLGPHFRFRHETGVEGAKAGALNLAFASMDPRATHIVTVDADYSVTSDFLTEAVRWLRKTGADYVQFPQAYRRESHLAQGVDIELEDYFRVEAEMADGAEAVLLTGTLCVISRDALDGVAGWSGRTSTEDAELGMRLCEAGFTGRFVARIVGKGLLPLAFQDLALQRARWSGGNLRTLAHHLPAMLRLKGQWAPRKAAAAASQLGAWLNFGLIPAAFLFACSSGRGSRSLATVAALSIILAFLDIIARLVERGVHDRLPLHAVLSAIATRIALAPTAAIATINALLPLPQRFIVTAKDVSSGWRPPVAALPHVLLFVAATTVAFRPSMGLLPDLAILVLLLPLMAMILTGVELSHYRRSLAKAALSTPAQCLETKVTP